MKSRRIQTAVLAVALAAVCLPAGLIAQNGLPADPILKAMQDELERVKTIRIGGLDQPYYAAYAVEDITGIGLSASLGALLNRSDLRIRLPRVEVRVGAPEFDNTNYVLSDYSGGNRFDLGELPLDADYTGLRREFWLMTDRLYKAAVEVIARKRSALKNMAVQEKLPDFTHAEPVQFMMPPAALRVDVAGWTRAVKSLSARFKSYPEILDSRVDFNCSVSNTYQANTEGSAMRFPEGICYVRILATSQASDGMPLRDALVIPATDAALLPPFAELERRTVETAENLKALLHAPVGEDYSGPVLVEGMAAPQLFALLLGESLGIPRRPVSEPGRPASFQASDLEGRQGSRILPDFMNVVDDPTQKEWQGRPLFGHYVADMECVRPVAVEVVRKGELKNYLLTRTPLRGFSGSHGRARLPGRYGSRTGTFGNLFVQAERTSTLQSLRKQMLEMCERRGKPYGVILRKLDFPYAGGMEELRRISASGGRGDRLSAPPLLAYRLYPDGREELVRGLKFRNLNVRSLRDILAASDEQILFEFIANTAPLSMMGAGGYVAGQSVVAPSLLFEDMELDRRQEDWEKRPLVPPPPVSEGQ